MDDIGFVGIIRTLFALWSRIVVDQIKSNIDFPIRYRSLPLPASFPSEYILVSRSNLRPMWLA